MNIKDLHKQGHSVRHIARISGHARNTVQRALHPQTQPPAKKRGRKSALEPFKNYLLERFLATGLSGVRLFQEIRQMGYNGAVDAVQRYLQTIDEPRRALNRATVRFETPPGEQAQVDWADVGCFLDDCGVSRKVYAFVMILGFSRMLYVEFTLRMHLPELIACHKHAFEHFGGWTHQILYDNMKQVRLNQNEWNPLMRDFLAHYGIAPNTCRPYRPRTKGKVERSIRYLKDNFIKGCYFSDFADLKAKGQHWQSTVANVRIHATTGMRPVDLLEAEKLTALSSAVEYRLSERFERTVDSESFVRLCGNRYSVPPSVVGRKVVVEQGEQRIVVRLGETIVAEHRAATGRGESVAKPEHVAAMWRLAMARTTSVPVATASNEKRMLFEQTVATRPLAVYEEAAR